MQKYNKIRKMYYKTPMVMEIESSTHLESASQGKSLVFI